MAEALLSVKRSSPKDIKIRDLYVELDGKEVANVAYNSSFETPLPAGEHTITATNRLFNRNDTFTCEEGQQIEYEVANVASGCGGLMFVVVGMGPYSVELKRTH